MKAAHAQPGLFDTEPHADDAQAAIARAPMHDMIDHLRTTATPPWKDQMAVILDDGAFKRAMRLVPAEEAQTLWAEFDAHTEWLYAIWLAAKVQQDAS